MPVLMWVFFGGVWLCVDSSMGNGIWWRYEREVVGGGAHFRCCCGTVRFFSRAPLVECVLWGALVPTRVYSLAYADTNPGHLDISRV